MAGDFSKTINLPSTAFPMKANLAQKEPLQIKTWQEKNYYAAMRQARNGKPKFILHDGPPYANGDIHMGTALNKILKDIIVRYKSLCGFDTPFVPGWDCHGLPIEHRVVKELKEKKKTVPLETLRRICRETAGKFVNVQREQFKRLGCIGDWEHPYMTMSPEYEAAIVDVFSRLVDEGYVYRGLKPIHWCPECETALAEAEMEYSDHTSPSIFVKFPLVKPANAKTANAKNYVMIWTTTPWTLAANTACAFNGNFEYVAAKMEGDWCVLAKDLLDSVLSKKSIDKNSVETVALTLKEVEDLTIRHPFLDRESRVVFAEYVTLDTGSGVVHTAPGHGQDDYQTGLKYGLPVLSPVDHQGKYTDEFPHMVGVSVWEANPKVIELLKEKNVLYFTEKITHTYPHCWRCKSPLIFRATEQWFFKKDHNDLRNRTVEATKDVTWVPSWGDVRMKNMIANGPDWCLSRQRAWGVPIPAFYCKKCGKNLLTKESVAHFSQLVKKHGVEVWFSLPVSELLPAGTKCSCGGTDFEKEGDILDVWFDAGVSSFAVLETREELSVPADVYIEGNDQYRGWFQAALWPAMALRNAPSYKNVITVGWMLDAQGKAMHKSAGNAVSPDEVTKVYGADILRLWVVSEDFKEDLRLGKELLDKTAESYRKIRNTFRYLLGNIGDFDPANDTVAVKDLTEVDRLELSRLHSFLKEAADKLNSYDFHLYYQRLVNYCNTELSSTYFDILKDRLYCDGKKSVTRRSAQTVLYAILEALVRVVAPVLPFTSEEVYRSYKGENAAPVQTLLWIPSDASLIDKTLEAKWDTVFKLRDEALKVLEVARAQGIIGKSLEGEILIMPKDDATKALIASMADKLNEVFIVSAVKLTDTPPENSVDGALCVMSAVVSQAPKCSRCWTHRVSVGTIKEQPELCDRCAQAI
ncbi:MAG: isoleucine--tRNA ligase [Spirochaetes bacterium]|nr:isoleucine--tRNA ligase [Spirochaetota bacterium]